MGARANEPEVPFTYPFDLLLLLFGQALQSLSRSVFSNFADDDVADSAAIFCNAFWRIFLELL